MFAALTCKIAIFGTWPPYKLLMFLTRHKLTHLSISQPSKTVADSLRENQCIKVVIFLRRFLWNLKRSTLVV